MQQINLINSIYPIKMLSNQSTAVIEPRGTRLYRCCRNTTTIFLTLILLIPAIYILGAQQSYHWHRPLYSAYQNNSFYDSKIAEIQALLKSKESILAINLHSDQDRSISQEQRTRNWENLVDFTEYLACYLNIQGNFTITQTISLPQVKQKRSKKDLSKDSGQASDHIYKLNKFGAVNTIKTKINKAASNILKRLKIQLVQPKIYEHYWQNWLLEFRNNLIKTVQSSKIWLIVIQPKNNQSYSSELLKKELTALSKDRPRDKFIVVTQTPVNVSNFRIKQLAVTIDQQVLLSIKQQVQTVILTQLNLNLSSYPKTAAAVLCKTNASLLHVNNFLFNCRHSNCLGYLELLSKKKLKKLQKSTQYAGISKVVKDLCEKGTTISEDDWEHYSKILGLRQEKDAGEELLKYFYELANGDKCKSQKSCNISWLYNESGKDQNVSIKIQSKEQPTTKKHNTISSGNQNSTSNKKTQFKLETKQFVLQQQEIEKKPNKSNKKPKKPQSKKAVPNSKLKPKKSLKSIQLQKQHQEAPTQFNQQIIQEDVSNSPQRDKNIVEIVTQLQENSQQVVNKQQNSLNIQLQDTKIDQENQQTVAQQTIIKEQTQEVEKQEHAQASPQQEQTIQIDQGEYNTNLSQENIEQSNNKQAAESAQTINEQTEENTIVQTDINNIDPEAQILVQIKSEQPQNNQQETVQQLDQ